VTDTLCAIPSLRDGCRNGCAADARASSAAIGTETTSTPAIVQAATVSLPLRKDAAAVSAAIVDHPVIVDGGLGIAEEDGREGL
jgi:hypothetical protein